MLTHRKSKCLFKLSIFISKVVDPTKKEKKKGKKAKWRWVCVSFHVGQQRKTRYKYYYHSRRRLPSYLSISLIFILSLVFVQLAHATAEKTATAAFHVNNIKRQSNHHHQQHFPCVIDLIGYKNKLNRFSRTNPRWWNVQKEKNNNRKSHSTYNAISHSRKIQNVWFRHRDQTFTTKQLLLFTFFPSLFYFL